MTDNVKMAAHIATLAARKCVLRKCTLSKPSDNTVVRSELSMMRLGCENALRLVTYMKDGKAIQKNITTDELADFFEKNAYGQINIITTPGNAAALFRCTISEWYGALPIPTSSLMLSYPLSASFAIHHFASL